MYQFGFPCSHPGFASGGQPRRSLQDVLTTIMFAASRGSVQLYVQHALTWDNHLNLEDSSATIIFLMQSLARSIRILFSMLCIG